MARRQLFKKSFSERNLGLTGLIGTVILAAILYASLNVGSLPGIGSGTTYSAQFAETGALASGDDVLVAGRVVGEVASVSLIGWSPGSRGNEPTPAHGLVKFKITDDGAFIGTGSRVKIVTETVLGKAALEIDSVGNRALGHGDTIPLSKTSAPYDVTQALSQLTTTTSELNTESLELALRTVAGELNNTPSVLTKALVGVSRVSHTLSSRDVEIQNLLSNSAALSGLLKGRNQQVTGLLRDGQQLLVILNDRRAQIVALLTNATAVSNQIHTLVTRNGAKLGPALAELDRAIQLLNTNKKNLQGTIEGLLGYVGGLGGAISSGPFFDAYLGNLQTPADLLPGVSALPCAIANQNLSGLLGITPPDGCS